MTYYYICCKNRYKLNTNVEDESGIANFTIFGRLVQDLIYIPTQSLATAVNSDKFTLPHVIKTIIDQKDIFQVVHDTQRFRTSIPSFKMLKIFTLNNNPKGKGQNKRKLFIKCEDQFYSFSNKKQVCMNCLNKYLLLQAPHQGDTTLLASFYFYISICYLYNIKNC